MSRDYLKFTIETPVMSSNMDFVGNEMNEGKKHNGLFTNHSPSCHIGHVTQCVIYEVLAMELANIE